MQSVPARYHRMYNQDKMGPTVLLLALLVHLGISNKLYHRYSGVVMIMEKDSDEYELQLCSSDTPICQINTTDPECTDNILCKQCDHQTLSSILPSATNCPVIIPTEGTTTHTITAGISPTVDNHPCTTEATETASAKNFNISQVALGATVGILGVLLAIVSTGWVCTCWVMKKRIQDMNVNTTNISRHSKKQVTNGNNTIQPLHNQGEMQFRHRNEYHNVTGNTQQESSEDQIQQDLNVKRVYDVIETPAVVHNTTTTNIQEASTEQHTNMATEQQQMSQNDTPGHRDMESHSDRQNQTRPDDGSQEDQTSTHIYHILEQQSEEHVELKDHKPAADYEVPVTSMAVHHQ